MSLLDELETQKMDRRPIYDDDKKVVIVNSYSNWDKPWHNQEYKIWFTVTSQIFSENVLKWRCKKLFNELQNIPAIENMSKVIIYNNDIICVGVNSDIKRGYEVIHLFWSVMTMFELCLEFEIESLCMYWFDGAHRRTYFKKTAILDIVIQFKKRNSSDSEVFTVNNLRRVTEMMIGRPVSLLEHTADMYRMARWYIKANKGRMDVFGSPDDNDTTKEI